MHISIDAISEKILLSKFLVVMEIMMKHCLLAHFLEHCIILVDVLMWCVTERPSTPVGNINVVSVFWH